MSIVLGGLDPRRSALAGGGVGLTLSNAGVADSAAAGSVVGTITAPAGYTLTLDDDCDGVFALVGSDLVLGATKPSPGWYQPTIGAHSGDVWDAAKPALGLSPVIDVAPVASPADIAGLVRAWRFDEGVTVDADGTSILSVAGAWGTAEALTGTFGTGAASPARPQRRAIGPNGKGLAYFAGSAAKSQFTFSSTGALAACTVFLVTDIEGFAGTVGALLGNQAGTTYVAHVQNLTANEFWTKQITARANGVSATSGLSASGQLDSRGLQLLRVVFDGANVTAACNGVVGASAAQVNAATWDTIGRTGAPAQGGSNHAQMHLAAALIFNRVLDAAEIAHVERCLQPFRTRDLFYAADGDDAAKGWSPAAPRRTPAALHALAGVGAYRAFAGARIMLREGDRFDLLAPLSFTGAGQPGRRNRIGSYSPAAGRPGAGRATLAGSDRITGGWTAVGDGTFTLARAAAPNLVWAQQPYNGRGRYTPLVNRATASDWSWQWAAGTLTCRFGDGFEPLSGDVEIGRNVSMINFGTDYSEVCGLDIVGSGGNEALRPRGAHVRIKRVTGYGGTGDLFSYGSDDVADMDCAAYGWGPGYMVPVALASSTSHDGSTHHQSTSAKSYRLKLIDHFWHANAHQTRSQVEMVDAELRNCGLPVYLPNATSDTGGAGSLTIRRSLVERSADPAAPADAIMSHSNHAMTVTVTGCRFEGLGPARGKVWAQPAPAASNPTFSADAGTSFTGFGSLS